MSDPKKPESGYLAFHKAVTDMSNLREDQANSAARKAIRTGDKKDIDEAKVEVARHEDRLAFCAHVIAFADRYWPRDEKGKAL